MKRRSIFNPLIISMLILMVISSCAVPARISSADLTNIKNQGPPNGKALVYIIRPGGFSGSAVAFRITCDDREIGSIRRKQFLYTVLDPGTHKFVGKAENKSEVILSVEANQVYYLTDQVQMGILYAENSLTRIDLAGGMQMLQKSDLSPNCLAYKVTK